MIAKDRCDAVVARTALRHAELMTRLQHLGAQKTGRNCEPLMFLRGRFWRKRTFSKESVMDQSHESSVEKVLAPRGLAARPG